ncbi:MAG TPA: hypothetical protein P5306_06735, partial [Kiritimatiellia bacterium]|nr:hypothetical protein [Kiritimatiellia bacterium]
MKTRSTLRLAAIALAVTMAMPLSASARHHRSEDVLAGAVVGAVVGTFIAAAASSRVDVVPACPAPVYCPEPVYYPAPVYGPPPPPPAWYHYAPPPRPAH